MSKDLVVIEKTKKNALTEVKQAYTDGSLLRWKNYSPEQALTHAVLKIKDMTMWDKNSKRERPILEVCTSDSIKQALVDMMAQGLDAGKGQCYFIPKKGKLLMMRDYLGSIALIKRLNKKIADVNYAVVFEGDDFSYELEFGNPINIKHKQSLINIKSNSTAILGAYAVAVDHNGKPLRTIIKSWSEIQVAWGQSPQEVFDSNGNVIGKTHSKFPIEMAKRTVINALCKHYIRTADDYELLHESFNRSEIIVQTEEVEAEKEELANNGDVVDIEETIEEAGEEVEEEVVKDSEFAFNVLEAIETAGTLEQLEKVWKENVKQIKANENSLSIILRFNERKKEIKNADKSVKSQEQIQEQEQETEPTTVVADEDIEPDF